MPRTGNTRLRTSVRSAVVLIALAVSTVAHAAQQDTIAEIRVHGNHTTPEDDVRRIAGLTVGELAAESRLEEARQRLADSGRFAEIDLRRRLRSIADPSQILIVIVVTEHAGITPDGTRPGIGGRIRLATMWLPIVRYDDGYGFTYGARVSFVDAIGVRSRVSVPLTWGGDRRAGLEVERTFDGPITRVRGDASMYRRVNPHYDLADVRQEIGVEVERAWTTWLRTGAGGRIARVGFNDAHTRLSSAGAFVAIDTRIDPSFPRNAVHAQVGWDALAFGDRPATIGRWLGDVRGYVGIGGSRVLALRGYLSRASGPLPPWEQALIGGGGMLRGYRTGHRAGDSAAVVSAEVRWPLTSPLRAGRLGVKGFVDAGTVWAAGTRLRDQEFDRGIGGGFYAGVSVLQLDFDLAWAKTGRARGHFGLGLTF